MVRFPRIDVQMKSESPPETSLKIKDALYLLKSIFSFIKNTNRNEIGNETNAHHALQHNKLNLSNILINSIEFFQIFILSFRNNLLDIIIIRLI